MPGGYSILLAQACKVLSPQNSIGGAEFTPPWDPWLPVVKNSRLFAQRTVHPHRAVGKMLRFGAERTGTQGAFVHSAGTAPDRKVAFS